jgi:hypothetical protein
VRIHASACDYFVRQLAIIPASACGHWRAFRWTQLWGRPVSSVWACTTTAIHEHGRLHDSNLAFLNCWRVLLAGVVWNEKMANQLCTTASSSLAVVAPVMSFDLLHHPVYRYMLANSCFYATVTPLIQAFRNLFHESCPMVFFSYFHIVGSQKKGYFHIVGQKLCPVIKMAAHGN